MTLVRWLHPLCRYLSPSSLLLTIGPWLASISTSSLPTQINFSGSATKTPPCLPVQAASALLNDEQREVFDTVVAHHSVEMPKPLRLLVLGTGGCGKLYLLGCLSQSFCGSWVVLAPTGDTALNVNGSTYHSFLCLGETASSYNALHGPHVLEFQRAHGTLGYIIIEKISMPDCRALLAIDQRPRKVGPDVSSVLFGGFLIIRCR